MKRAFVSVRGRFGFATTFCEFTNLVLVKKWVDFCVVVF